MFSISVKGDEKLIDHFEGMGAEVRAALMTTIPELATSLQSHVVNDKLHGQVLNEKSGALARSIEEEAPIEQGSGIYGRVFSSGDVKYAAIHEYGGVIPGHDIAAKNGQALAFLWNGKQVFFKSVHIPDVTMPERSFLRSSLADQSAEIIQGMKDAVLRGASNALKG